MDGYGRRQREILSLLESAQKPLPVGYLIRATEGSDPRLVDSSLRLLSRRGVVRRVRYGVWELA